MLRTTALFVSLIASSSLSAQTSITDSLFHDGLWRTYRLFLPTGFNAATPAPLVLNFHGYGSNALEQEFYSGFDQVADTAGVVVAYPNGIGAAFEPFHTVDDVGFVDALIARLHDQYNVNLNRVYSTGLSNGGFMTFVLVCELAHRFAAVADVAGSMQINGPALCEPSETLPTLHIHGTADNVVPYNGNGNFISVTNLMTFWAQRNGCSTTPTVTALPNVAPADGTTTDVLEYGNCQDAHRVVLYRVNGGGHTWPGASFAIGVTSQDFKASVVIWQFFRQYERGVNVATGEAAAATITVAPNPASSIVRVDLGTHAAVDVSMVDATGRVVYSAPRQQGVVEIALVNLAAGLYSIECRHDGQLQRFRVVKI
jgi:polyhydroxybutyrate depolymerase